MTYHISLFSAFNDFCVFQCFKKLNRGTYPMRLTFIGTSSGLTVIDRSHACIYLEIGDKKLLLDCGEGTTRSLLKLGFDPSDIDLIIISHTHPDHCAGIPTLMQYMHLIGRKSPLSISIPQGISPAFETYFRQLYLLNEKLTFDYELNEYAQGVIYMHNDVSLEAIPNLHLFNLFTLSRQYGISIASYSLIIRESSKTVYYSADLQSAADLNPPEKADLMIVESTHIKIEDALAIASAKNIKRIIFTHIGPEIDTDTLDINTIPAEYAHDGMSIII